MIYNIGKNDLF